MRLLIAATLVLAATAMTSAQTKQIVRSGPDLGLPFSPAVKAGGLIYVSGTVATDANGKIIAGDIKAQTRQTLNNIQQVLHAAGSSLANAASVMVYLTDASDFAAMNEVYQTFWPRDPPARTTIVAPLALAGARIEISMVAVPDGGERTGHPAGGLDQVAQPVQLRHQDRRHAVPLRARQPERQGQLARDRRHHDADQHRPRQRRTDSQGRRHELRRRRQRARLHHRHGQLPGDERGLPRALPGGAARARDGEGRADDGGLPDRDHDGRGQGRLAHRDRHAERRRHAGRGEPEPERGDSRRPPPVSLRHAGHDAGRRRQRRRADDRSVRAHRRARSRRPASTWRTSSTAWST